MDSLPYANLQIFWQTVHDGTDEAYIKSFQIEKIKRDSFLKPCGKDDMYVYYNKFKGIYEAVSRADALKDEGFGMIIIPTPCQP